MATRLTLNGRIVQQSRDLYAKRPDPRLSVPRSRKGDIIQSARPIGPEEPQSPFRAGVPYTDPEDGVTYRVVLRLDPLEGWASQAFWVKRWKVLPQSIAVIVQHGLLDAAMEQNTYAKRYRARDERIILESPVLAQERKRAQAAQAQAVEEQRRQWREAKRRAQENKGFFK